MRRKIVFGALISGFSLFSPTAPAQVQMHLVRMSSRFVVVAHRGDHTAAPENTLTAYAHAIDDGVDFIEVDLRTTKDSQLVIMHDASVDRMTDGKGKVRDMMFEEIRKLKVTDRNHPEWEKEAVPSFMEVLRLAKDRVNVYLDFKDADPGEAYRQILEAGLKDQVIVYLNSEQQYFLWRSVAPGMPLMGSLPGAVRDTDSMKDFLGKFKLELLDGDYDQYSPEMILLANRLGYRVLPDIQGPGEGPGKWDLAIRKGIRGLQTDHPADLIRYLESRQLR